jgi:hypothetical protein
MKLKRLNKKREIKKEKNKFVKVLDLFLWHQVQVLALLIGIVSVPLFLLKVGMLDCVAIDAVPLCWTD